MSTTTEISPAILRASKKAVDFKYDTSKYVVMDLKVRRDVETGRLVLKRKSNA